MDASLRPTPPSVNIISLTRALPGPGFTSIIAIRGSPARNVNIVVVYSVLCMGGAWLHGVQERSAEDHMPLINIVLVLIVVGVLLWLINRFIPMQGTIKSILNAVVVIAVVLWLLQVFGLFNSLAHIRVGS